MAENTYFPIQQTPACPLKWNWSTVWCTQGVSSSCFRNKKLDIDINNFDEFHNHPEKIKEREITCQHNFLNVLTIRKTSRKS